MALYDLKDDEVKFLKNMVTKVLPQGTREEIKLYIDLGDKVLVSLGRPIHSTGKPKLLKQNEADIRGLTDEEQKVINESKCIS